MLVARPGATPASTCAQNCLCRLPRRVSPSAWGTWGAPRLGSPWARGWCWSWVGGRRTEGRKTRTVPPVGQCSGPWISHSNTKHQTHSGCETVPIDFNTLCHSYLKSAPSLFLRAAFRALRTDDATPAPDLMGDPPPKEALTAKRLGPNILLHAVKDGQTVQ